MLTLSSDFGSQYPAAMKGVILQHSDARVTDVTHSLPRQDIRAGAFWCRELLTQFPPAVHVIVVDPGVGTDRAALVVQAGSHILVGPDNGILRPVARKLTSTDEPKQYYRLTVESRASTTFHGRDVFAPAAVTIHERGLDRLVSTPFLTPVDTASLTSLRLPGYQDNVNEYTGSVIAIDNFGNVITSIPGTAVDAARISVNGQSVPFVQAFAAVEPGSALVTTGSHGYLECDVNQGRGECYFDLSTGDMVSIRTDTE
ncbi:MAG: hypothetical protein J07HQX50_00742 [Haloquadratum sp. J07HQX50]|jgi:Uncharacterized conserved protein|nr:MAG: hypothetical protein J07HQX50_00742 [Haloquadratum sp. J07HQX50]